MFLLVHQVAFCHTWIIRGHFRHVGTVGTFGTPIAFGTLMIGSVFSTLGIIPSEFWHIWWHFCTNYIVQVLAQSTAEI